MTLGKMTIGFAGVENIKISNIKREECLTLIEKITDGRKIACLGDELWVNPTQITYIKFKKN